MLSRIYKITGHQRLCRGLLLSALLGSFGVTLAETTAPTTPPPVKKSTLKTVLPFRSFCGSKLTVLPPNIPLITDFAEKTAIQSFTFDYKGVSKQFSELEKCFTASGWKSFTNAIAQSGNLRSTVDEKLFVSAKIDGDIEIIDHNEYAPSWKVLVPLNVRYENETHYLTQSLNVKLVVTIEDKVLGVEQIIASISAKPHKFEVPLSEDHADQKKEKQTEEKTKVE